MDNDHSQTTNVVKKETDYAKCQSVTVVAMTRLTTLEERLRSVMKSKGWTQREWPEKAGLSHGAISSFFSRAQKDPDATMHGSALKKLATAADISLAWLVSGEGEPDTFALAPADPPALREVRTRVDHDDEEIPECLGDFKGYDAQEKRARKQLGNTVDEWVWPHVRAVNMLALANSGPPVAMLMAFAKALHDFGDPTAPVPERRRKRTSDES